MNKTPAAPALSAPRRSRVEEVVDIISDWIVDGELQAEERLPPEAELAVRFSVSRTVVREAVRLLAERGLVDVAHGRRHRVRPPSPDIAAEHMRRLIQRGSGSSEQLVEVRLSLEVSIAALAAERRSDEDLQAMRDCLEDQKLAKTLDDQAAQDIRFHRMLAQATGNVVFSLLLDAVRELLMESLRQTIGRAGTTPAVEQHTAIADAIEARDSQAAARLMRQHVERALANLRVRD